MIGKRWKNRKKFLPQVSDIGTPPTKHFSPRPVNRISETLADNSRGAQWHNMMMTFDFPRPTERVVVAVHVHMHRKKHKIYYRTKTISDAVCRVHSKGTPIIPSDFKVIAFVFETSVFFIYIYVCIFMINMNLSGRSIGSSFSPNFFLKHTFTCVSVFYNCAISDSLVGNGQKRNEENANAFFFYKYMIINIIFPFLHYDILNPHKRMINQNMFMSYVYVYTVYVYIQWFLGNPAKHIYPKCPVPFISVITVK